MLLFSTDIDGTVYDSSASAETFRNFWNRLQNQSNPPLLAYNTGRAIDDALELIEATTLPEPDFLIGGVGTEMYEFRTGTHLDLWTEILSANWYVDRVEKIVVSHSEDIEKQPDECQNPFKSSWYWHGRTRDDIDDLQAALSEAEIEAQVVYSSQRDLDILPVRANKGNAISWLADFLEIPYSQIAVAGDSGNDASMFLVDEVFGVIVSNAESSLPSAVSGARIFHSAHPCAEGVVEGLTRHLQSEHSSS